MERFNKPMNMGRNSPDLLEPNEYKARYAFGPFKIREPTYALHRAQTQPSHGSAVVPLGVGSGLRRRAVAAAGVEPRSFQPGTGTIRGYQFDGLALASLTSLPPRSPERSSCGRWAYRRTSAEFHDVYGIDADALDMVPQPVLAVILCFPDPPQVRWTFFLPVSGE